MSRPFRTLKARLAPACLALLMAACTSQRPPGESAIGPYKPQVGVASWYGPGLQGARTASGEKFDQDQLTAAHPSWPLQSLAQVTNLENGRQVVVRVNDRGPFAKDRLIDLSRAAARALGFEKDGEAKVAVRYLGPASQPEIKTASR